MRLTLVISSLSSGGAERVMSIMANYWAAKGWTITLLTLNDTSVPPFYDLDSRIKYIPLGVSGDSPNLLAAIWNNLKRIRTLRSEIVESKPDAIISFLDITNVLTLLATRKLKIPVIVDEQIHPAIHPIGRTWELLRQWTYPKAARVVAVTARALSYFSPEVQSRGCVIPNPALSVDLCESSPDKLLVKPSLIAVGRLHPQKGFDLLLQTFAQLKDSYPEWTLTILGEGSLRPELEFLRNQLGLADRVYLTGAVKNPLDFLKQADIFVMSSRFEGFPNALCEAMACGLPVISTDCPSGPREIIRDGVDGILVPNEDVSALAAGMARLMSDEKERKRLAARAPEVTKRFSLEKVMGMWEAIISEVISGETEMIAGDRQPVVLSQSYQYVFTVFTPAYNRAHTLYRVYESLKGQTYRDFEWLIIDDGSTDNTQKLVEQWQKENEFPIRYIYQKNGGLHIALNRGAREAKGELFLQLDSDDACVPEALARFKYHWDTIPLEQKENFIGVTCLCKDHNGNLVGSLFPFNPTDSNCLELDYRFKVAGEKWGFVRTNILQQFPYSEDIKGTYIPQTLIWHKIARKYKTRFVNEILRIYWMDQPSIVQGRPDPGKNALGSRLYHLTVLNEETDWFLVAPLSFLRSAVHYSRFSFHVGSTIGDQIRDVNTVMVKILWLIALPLGYLVYLKDNFLK